MPSRNAAAAAAVSPERDAVQAPGELLATALSGYAGAQSPPELHQAVRRLRYLINDYEKTREQRQPLYSHHERMDKLDSAVAWLERLVGIK